MDPIPCLIKVSGKETVASASPINNHFCFYKFGKYTSGFPILAIPALNHLGDQSGNFIPFTGNTMQWWQPCSKCPQSGQPYTPPGDFNEPRPTSCNDFTFLSSIAIFYDDSIFAWNAGDSVITDSAIGLMFSDPNYGYAGFPESFRATVTDVTNSTQWSVWARSHESDYKNWVMTDFKAYISRVYSEQYIQMIISKQVKPLIDLVTAFTPSILNENFWAPSLLGVAGINIKM